MGRDRHISGRGSSDSDATPVTLRRRRGSQPRAEPVRQACASTACRYTAKAAPAPHPRACRHRRRADVASVRAPRWCSARNTTSGLAACSAGGVEGQGGARQWRKGAAGSPPRSSVTCNTDGALASALRSSCWEASGLQGGSTVPVGLSAAGARAMPRLRSCRQGRAVWLTMAGLGSREHPKAQCSGSRGRRAGAPRACGDPRQLLHQRPTALEALGGPRLEGVPECLR